MNLSLVREANLHLPTLVFDLHNVAVIIEHKRLSKVGCVQRHCRFLRSDFPQQFFVLLLNDAANEGVAIYLRDGAGM